jgi:type II secretory pathway component PulF
MYSNNLNASFLPDTTTIGAMSSAFIALIWWLVPLTALIGALGYVLWVTKFQGRFEQETTRSVGQFQKFQDSLAQQQKLGSLPNETSVNAQRNDENNLQK